MFNLQSLLLSFLFLAICNGRKVPSKGAYELVDFSNATVTDDGSRECVNTTGMMEIYEKTPVYECVHKNEEQCHYTYVTQFEPTMVALGGISLLLGMLPVLLKRCCNIGQSATPKGQLLISALSCFGGGVILTTCFTHMLPEVNLFLALNIEKGQFPDSGKNIFPLLLFSNFILIFSFFRNGRGRDLGAMWIFHDLHSGRGHPFGRA